MKTKYSHIYFIPTNRYVSTCLTSYLEEIERAITILGDARSILLCIVEDGSEGISIKNKKLMEKVIKDKEEIPIIYISRELRDEFINSISGNDHKLYSLFFGEELNYGRIANICSLIASYYSVDYLHRRDSDTRLYIENDNQLFPIDFEIEYLKDKNAYMVGGNYFNQWNIDLSIFGNQKTLFKEFMRCLGIKEEIHETIIENNIKIDLIPKIPSPQIYLTNGAHPDMGNVSYKNALISIPFPPHNLITGTDYFQMIALMKSSHEVYLHNYSVLHIYQKDRKSKDAVIRYYSNIARFIDYLKLYETVFMDFEKKDIETITRNLVDSLQRALDRSYVLRNKRIDAIDNYLQLLKKSFTPFKEELIANVQNEIDNIIKAGTEGLRDHIYLAQHWFELIKKAKKSKAFESIKPMF